MDKQVILKQIVEVIRKYLGEEYRLYLFGSWAKGGALETSDFDIGILGMEKVSWSVMTKINEEVSKIPTLRKIDIVDLTVSSERFRKSALESAKELDKESSMLAI